VIESVDDAWNARVAPPSVRLRLGRGARGEAEEGVRARCTYSPHLYSNSSRPIRVAAARKYRRARAAPLALTPPSSRSVVWRVLYRRGYRKYRERPESRQLFYGPARAYERDKLSLFRDRRDRERYQRHRSQRPPPRSPDIDLARLQK